MTPTSRNAGFWQAFGLNIVWMNLSETARYFLLVRPLMRRDFSEVPGITPDSPSITALWVAWDTVLIAVTTAIVWLVLDRYGPRRSVALAAAALVWASVFVLLWLGLHNMGLAPPRTAFAALALAFLEVAVAAELVRRRYAATSERRPQRLPSSVTSSGTAVL